MKAEALAYGSYLRLDELLSLQSPGDEMEHDEMLFVVAHQVYELWFKEILHEIHHAQRLMEDDDRLRARRTLERILVILKVLVVQLDALETLTPLEFASFRDRVDTASGFQSDQFRALEFELGRKSRQAIARYPAGSRAREGLEHRWGQPTLWDAFLTYLRREGYDVPRTALERDVTAPVEPSTDIQEILLEVYRDDPGNAELCERLVDLDVGFQEWRYRHGKMVERTVGTKVGTAGSPGSAHLGGTLDSSVFPDLWAIRSRL